MDPVAFEIFGLTIRWYGIMMAGAMLVGAFLSAKLLTKIGRDGEIVWDGLFYIILCGVLGARLVYVLTNVGAYFGSGIPFWKVFAVWEGGLSFHGGIIGGVVATYFYFKSKPIPLVEILDAFALGITPGIIMVRFGNYMNGDILGYKTDLAWGMNFPLDSYHIPGSMYYEGQGIVLRHPAELYGMAVGLICLVTAIYLWDKTYLAKRFNKGTVAWGVIFWYSLIRSIIEEPFRAVPLPWKVIDPAEYGFGLFTTTQIASALLILLSLWGFSQLGKWERLRAAAAVEGTAAQPKKSGKVISRQEKRAADRQKKKNS